MAIITLFCNAPQNDIEKADQSLDQYLRSTYLVHQFGPTTGKMQDSDRNFVFYHYHLLGRDALVQVGKANYDPKYGSAMIDVTVSSGINLSDLVDEVHKAMQLQLSHAVSIQQPLFLPGSQEEIEPFA